MSVWPMSATGILPSVDRICRSSGDEPSASLAVTLQLSLPALESILGNRAQDVQLHCRVPSLFSLSLLGSMFA